MQYAVVIESAPGSNYSAYVPDVDGCVAVGDTVEETLAAMHDALALHLAALAEDGDPVPQPTSLVAYVDVPVHASAR
jgi:predicted RNase H-like HicB family nuclease